MKIYVVETIGDDTVQLGFSTSKKVAEKKAEEWKEYFYNHHGYKKPVWITEYSEGKNQYCDFD